MAKTKISEFNANPALNTDIDSINIAEGCAPSGINDAIRELMAQLKDWQSGTSNDPMVIGSSGSLTLNQGTANGVAYLNGSKVVTSGSALTFDGTNLGVGVSSPSSFGGKLVVKAITDGNFVVRSIADIGGSDTGPAIDCLNDAVSAVTPLGFRATQYIWRYASSEGMRLTSTGLGIGTSSPVEKVQSSKGIAATGANQSVGSLNGFVADYSSGASRIFASRNGVASSTLELWTTDSGGAANKNATLDSSGNLGLGVTPSAWYSTRKAMQVGSAGVSIAGSTNLMEMRSNAYLNTSAQEIYVTSAAASLYAMNNGVHYWYNAPSGTAGNAITFTQAMTLDASGRWLLGTTTGVGNDFTSIRFNSSSTYSQGMNMVDANASSNGGVFMVFRKSDDTGLGAIKRSGTDTALAIDGNSYLAFQTGGTERARIDSSGSLLVGATGSIAGVTGPSIQVENNGTSSFVAKQLNYNADTLSVWNSATGGDNRFIYFYTETSISARGSITYNRAGGLTAYNTTSDYRAKDISGPVTNSGALIDATPVYMGKMKGATQERPMFIAHETPSYAHTGEKDAVDEDGNPVYQQMDASALIPVMWAEIQSLRKRLADAGL